MSPALQSALDQIVFARNYTNKLLAALAEQQIVEAKRTRDAEASAINNHIQFMGQAKGVMAAQASDASSAMLNWRMP